MAPYNEVFVSLCTVVGFFTIMLALTIGLAWLVGIIEIGIGER